MARRKKTADEEMDKRQQTIQERQRKQQREFLQHLKRNGNIELSAQKAGIHRSTIYRWTDEFEDFQKAMSYAMKEGVSVMSDNVELWLLKAAKDGNATAITFYLRNRHPAYLHVRFQEKYIDAIAQGLKNEVAGELTPEQRKEHMRVLKLFGLTLPDTENTDEK
jgi:hypothetical protein